MRADNRRNLIVLILAVVLALALLSWQLSRFRPPSSARLATGPEGEHEFQTALIYKEYVAQQGVDLEIIPTGGSLEIMELVQTGAADAGLMLNAANLGADDTDLVALAAVNHVPIWVFYRSELEADGPLTDLADLRGRRISLGQANSGTRALSRLLLRTAQIPESDFRVVEASPYDSAELLIGGEIDAMFLVSGIRAESMANLVLAPGIEILNFEMAETYARLVPFLQTTTLLEGSLNIGQRNPDEDKHLLTDAGILISREDLHPDLQMLLLNAAIDTQNQMFDLFPTDEDFPSTKDLTLPVSSTTEQFLKEGQTALQRYLPFWIASPLERFYLLMLPFLLLLYPLLRNTPTAYGAYMRRRVFIWYKRVRKLELGLHEYTIDELEEHIRELEALQARLTETLSVSTGYLQTFYNLRVHIRLVMERLRERKAFLEALGLGPDDKPPADTLPSTSVLVPPDEDGDLKLLNPETMNPEV